MAIEAEKLTGDNIYKVLIYFDKFYEKMNDSEKRQSNGQWLKSIKFKLPIIEEDMELSLDNDTYVITSSLSG